MKTLILFILLKTTLTAQDTIKIDIVKVYEDVLKMGYKSEQIYDVLIYKKLKG